MSHLIRRNAAMSFQVSCFDEQIIIARLSNPFDDVISELLHLTECVAELMLQIPAAPVYRILDLSELTLSFGEMVFAVAVETRGTPGSLSDLTVNHVVVTTDREIKEAIKALEYPRITITETMPQALDIINADRASKPRVENMQQQANSSPP